MNGWLRYNVRCSADVAQSVEHLIGNEEVGSSNLLISSKKKMHPDNGVHFLLNLGSKIGLFTSQIGNLGNGGRAERRLWRIQRGGSAVRQEA